jgi:hypothetical protein
VARVLIVNALRLDFFLVSDSNVQRSQFSVYYNVTGKDTTITTKKGKRLKINSSPLSLGN